MAIPVIGLHPTCQTISMILGQSDVNAGAAIHVNPTAVAVAAQSGGLFGGLLGNLLCTVSNLLGNTVNNTVNLTDIAGTLNQILGQL